MLFPTSDRPVISWSAPSRLPMGPGHPSCSSPGEDRSSAESKIFSCDLMTRIPNEIHLACGTYGRSTAAAGERRLGMAFRQPGLATVLPELARPLSAMATVRLSPHDRDMSRPQQPGEHTRKRSGGHHRPRTPLLSVSRPQSADLTPKPPSTPRTPRRYQLDDDVRSVSSASTHLSCMSITPRHAYFQRQAARLDATPHGLLTKISAHLPGAYLVRDAFCFFDREKTGRVTYEDFRAQIERFGLIGGEETTLTLFNTYDRDGKGYLLFEDFQNIHKQEDKGNGVSTFTWPHGMLTRIAPSPVKALSDGEALANLLREKVNQRARGRYNLLKCFKADEHSLLPELDYDHFRKGCTRFGMHISDADMRILFEHFGGSRDGKINSLEFIDNVACDVWTRRNQQAQPLYLCTFNDFERRRQKIVAKSSPTVPAQHSAAFDTLRQEIRDPQKLNAIRGAFERDKGQLSFPQFRRVVADINNDLELSVQDLRTVFESASRFKGGQIQYRDLLGVLDQTSKSEGERKTRRMSTPVPPSGDVVEEQGPNPAGDVKRPETPRCSDAVRTMIGMKDFSSVDQAVRSRSRCSNV